MSINQSPELNAILITLAASIDRDIALNQIPNEEHLEEFGLLTNIWNSSGNPLKNAGGGPVMLQSTPEQIDASIANIETLVSEAINATTRPYLSYVKILGYLLNIKATGNPLDSGGDGGNNAVWSS